MFWRYIQSPSQDLALNTDTLICLQIWIPCPVTSLFLEQNLVFLSLWELLASTCLSAPCVGNDTYWSSQTSFRECSHAMCWVFLMIGRLLLTWRPKRILCFDRSVQEIPIFHVVLMLSLLLVVHTGCAAASHFLEIKSLPLLPISLLSPHDENIAFYFPTPWMGKSGQTGYCGLLH